MSQEKSENQPIYRYEVKKMLWDTNFFGYSVGSIDLRQYKDIDVSRLKDVLIKSGTKVCYCYSESTNQVIQDRFKEYGIEIADRKVTFIKSISADETTCSPEIINVLGSEMTPKILEIALQSGVYSRFKRDPEFHNNEYEKLYTEWITKSMSGDIALAVLVFYIDGDEAGLITVGDKNGIADIGLLAVDQNYRGKGIGKKLVKNAEVFAKNIGFDKIQVVSQLDNQIACSLYEKCGFSVLKTENIYHVWS